MIKLFISQPMRGKSNEEIRRERERAMESVRSTFDDEVEVIDSFFEGAEDANPLEMLGRSIQLMAKADVVYFVDGWEEARGCRIEHRCAEDYGLQIAVEINAHKYPELLSSVEKFVEKYGHLFGGNNGQTAVGVDLADDGCSNSHGGGDDNNP